MRRLACVLLPLLFISLFCQAQRQGHVQVAVFSLNDFHGTFVCDTRKGQPGAAAVLHTLDSLKRIYPYNLTLSAGDNFGGSYFYRMTRGQLMPAFFAAAGITTSALGNHEFDDGLDRLALRWSDSPLRPQGWNVRYLCANVRDEQTGRLPQVVQPYCVESVQIGRRQLRIGLLGMISAGTPHQVSASRIKGYAVDGRYPEVVDSLSRLPDYQREMGSADVRLLLLHVGASQKGPGRSLRWEDDSASAMLRLPGTTFSGILSGHSHDLCCTHAPAPTALPVVQGGCYGHYISMLCLDVDTATMQVQGVWPEVYPVSVPARLDAAAERLQQLTDSLLRATRTEGGTSLAQSVSRCPEGIPHNRAQKLRLAPLGTLVCQAYADTYRQHARTSDDEVVVGLSHFGTLRTSLPKGPVSALDLGEVLPFNNPMRAYRITGRELRELCQFGFHNVRLGWLQSAGLRFRLRDKQNPQLLAMTYVTPSGRLIPIEDSTPCTIVLDDYIAQGGDGYLPSFFPEDRRVDSGLCLPHSTDAFIRALSGKSEISGSQDTEDQRITWE